MTYTSGDIFRWRWKENHPRREQCNGTGTLYWCMSQICVADSAGRLFDTYWNGGNNRLVSPDECDLEYVANKADLVKIEPYQRDYYADRDVVDLNHANSSAGNLYIRKGAAKCALKMLEVLNQKKEQCAFEINYRQRSIERINEQILLIELDKIDEVYL